MATSIQLPAEEKVMREGHRSPQRAANYAHLKNIKKGVERKDRHSSSGMNPSPKKAGRGGRFTWEGSQHDDYEAYDRNNALDDKDPNYVDEEEERAPKGGAKEPTPQVEKKDDGGSKAPAPSAAT